MKDKNVVLDLDNTLICAQPLPDDIIKNFNYETMGTLYRVYERPHLQQFLDHVFANYNVAVWTAAGKEYAMFIVNKFILVKPGRTIDFLMFNAHCTLSTQLTGNLKNLSLLWLLYKIPNYTNDNTIIIDDNTLVYNPQKKNAILIKAFKYNDDDCLNDEELINMKESLNKRFNDLTI